MVMRQNDKEELKALLSELVECAREDVKETAPTQKLTVKDGVAVVYQVLGILTIVLGFVVWLVAQQGRIDRMNDRMEVIAASVTSVNKELSEERGKREVLEKLVWEKSK
jgi:hypothetical protein